MLIVAKPGSFTVNNEVNILDRFYSENPLIERKVFIKLNHIVVIITSLVVERLSYLEQKLLIKSR